MRKYNTRKPWQAGLIAATALSLISLFAWQLSQSGHAEWAFMLVFGSVWCLTALFWANDGFNEESGLMLAEAVDENIEHLQKRLLSLEQGLQELQSVVAESGAEPGAEPGAKPAAESFRLPRTPVARDQWV